MRVEGDLNLRRVDFQLTADVDSMKSSPKSRSFLALIPLCLSISIYVVLSADFVPTEKILLNCGADVRTTDTDSRQWAPDVNSKFAAAVVVDSKSATATTQEPSVTQAPFMIARVFLSGFTYSFPVIPGPEIHPAILLSLFL